jgi:hypothetical protein
VKRAGVGLACLALAACQSAAPTTAPRTSDAAHALNTALAGSLKACWFSGDAAFAGYLYTPEVNAGAPRILIVAKDDPNGRPLLVIEPTGAAAASVYGPLLASPVGARAKGDLDRWIAGGSGCVA